MSVFTARSNKKRGSHAAGFSFLTICSQRQHADPLADLLFCRSSGHYRHSSLKCHLTNRSRRRQQDKWKKINLGQSKPWT